MKRAAIAIVLVLLPLLHGCEPPQESRSAVESIASAAAEGPLWYEYLGVEVHGDKPAAGQRVIFARDGRVIIGTMRIIDPNDSGKWVEYAWSGIEQQENRVRFRVNLVSGDGIQAENLELDLLPFARWEKNVTATLTDGAGTGRPMALTFTRQE
ncbi:MAG: hypothetical protein WD069_02705 [Planctomycetales bacterium]